MLLFVHYLHNVYICFMCFLSHAMLAQKISELNENTLNPPFNSICQIKSIDLYLNKTLLPLQETFWMSSSMKMSSFTSRLDFLFHSVVLHILTFNLKKISLSKIRIMCILLVLLYKENIIENSKQFYSKFTIL